VEPVVPPPFTASAGQVLGRVSAPVIRLRPAPGSRTERPLLDASDDSILERLYADAPASREFGKLRKRIIRDTRAALETYAMVSPRDSGGQRWLVCISGGKDSYTLLAALIELK